MEPSPENETREPEVADVENLKLEPKVELHIVEALCAKFESIIKGYCDLSLFRCFAPLNISIIIFIPHS